MIIYLCVKYESNTLIFQKIMKRNHFSKLKKGHKSHNNWWIYPKSNLTYITYLCIKYESHTLIISIDIEEKSFFLHTDCLNVLGFNNTSTLVGHSVSSPQEGEKKKIEEIAEEMKEKDREERGTGIESETRGPWWSYIAHLNKQLCTLSV